MTLLVGVLLPADTTANRPAAASVGEGTLFPSTDDLIVYQQVGGSWVTWADYSGVSPGGTIGQTKLVYRYTVTGSDKASIDTGVDTPDAGDNVWTGGDLLEVFMYLRTDEAAGQSGFSVVLNNDTSSIYDQARMSVLNVTVSGAPALSQAAWLLATCGASDTANVFGAATLTIPNYAGTVGFKNAWCVVGAPDHGTAGNAQLNTYGLNYGSTAALTRLKILPTTGGKKFTVGSQLLIYKRLSS